MDTDRMLGRDRPGSPEWAHWLGMAAAPAYAAVVVDAVARMLEERFPGWAPVLGVVQWLH
ncbi:MAG: hypothetical protein F4045_01725 [Chloroflexi bacterium]|nr:hypothetical protein [Chloroflexota bacterium]MYK33853.1 hypothetical protein [Chloroflexota bacterium]